MVQALAAGAPAYRLFPGHDDPEAVFSWPCAQGGKGDGGGGAWAELVEIRSNYYFECISGRTDKRDALRAQLDDATVRSSCPFVYADRPARSEFTRAEMSPRVCCSLCNSLRESAQDVAREEEEKKAAELRAQQAAEEAKEKARKEHVLDVASSMVREVVGLAEDEATRREVRRTRMRLQERGRSAAGSRKTLPDNCSLPPLSRTRGGWH